MNNTFENELWEAILKAAVVKHTLEENAEIPSEEEIPDDILPENCEKKLRCFVKNYAKRKTQKTLLSLSRRIAVFVFIVIGAIFITLLQFEEVRAACWNVIVSFYEDHIKFEYNNTENIDMQNVSIKFIPESFTLEQAFADEWNYYCRYVDQNNNFIEITCCVDRQTLSIDNEHYNITPIIIDGFEGYFFDSQDPHFFNYLTLTTDKAFIMIRSALDYDTISKIAQNINFISF